MVLEYYAIQFVKDPFNLHLGSGLFIESEKTYSGKAKAKPIWQFLIIKHILYELSPYSNLIKNHTI